VSAGIAELTQDDDPTAFFERADEALYRAKERGKGQVVADKPEAAETNGDDQAANTA
jgi:PleD family two-component response regulator